MTTVVEPTLSLSAEAQVQASYELVKFGPPPPTSSPFGCCSCAPPRPARLAEHMSGNNKAKTASAPPVAVLGYDLDFHENAAKTFPYFPGIKDAFAEESSRHASGRDNAFLQAGYFIVGVRAAGLAARAMAGFDSPGSTPSSSPAAPFPFGPRGQPRAARPGRVVRPAPTPCVRRGRHHRLTTAVSGAVRRSP